MNKVTYLGKLKPILKCLFSMIITSKTLVNVLKGKGVENKGFTLLEVIVVLTILGVLSAIAVPSTLGVIEKTKQDVCDANLLQIERMYETHLILANIDHSDVAFSQYLQEYGESICDDCDLTYVDGVVQCSVDSSDDEGESVPFL
jgi:prepilin-type N-terminal cleavage/methylation domain-containing protein